MVYLHIHGTDIVLIPLRVNNDIILSKKSVKVLGVLFDGKLR
jgi:hypothetical protein